MACAREATADSVTRAWSKTRRPSISRAPCGPAGAAQTASSSADSGAPGAPIVETATTWVTCCGRAAASDRATAPPIEWPTTA